MAKPGDWQAELLQGLELAGALTQGNVTANASTATALSATSVPILWVVLQNQGSANVFFGDSTVLATGSTAGPRMTPNGETAILKVDDLSKLFVISASGNQTLSYIAGKKGTYS